MDGRGKIVKNNACCIKMVITASDGTEGTVTATPSVPGWDNISDRKPGTRVIVEVQLARNDPYGRALELVEIIGVPV